jgi:hypothetical protein
MKSKKWAGYIARMAEISAYKISARNREGKGSLWRRMRRWEEIEKVRVKL